MSRLIARVLAVFTAAIVMAPMRAEACPVCGFSGTQDNWTAYLAMTAMLSLLPLGMIGGITLWVYRRARDTGGRD